MKTIHVRAAATAAVLLLGLAGCGIKQPAASQAAEKQDESSSLKPAAKRNPAPNFTLKDVDGKPVSLADYKGKVVLLNFWATWCGPCKIEIPWFKDFQKAYKDKGFTVIGVALDDEGWDAVRPYITEKQVNYPVVIGTPEVEQLYGSVEALPTSFIIDKEGRIANVHVGLVGRSDYENDILALLR